MLRVPVVLTLPTALLAVLVAAGVAGAVDTGFPVEREAVYRQMLNLRELVKGGIVEPRWMLDGRSFWYVQGSSASTQVLRVDPTSNSAAPLFDVGRLRAALASFLDHEQASQDLQFATFELVDNERSVRFSAAGRVLKMDLVSYEITDTETSTASRLVLPQSAQALALYGPAEVPARKGPRRAVFEAYNLQLRSSADERSSALTTDGSKEYSWSLHPFSWSPQDDLLLVTRNDWRKVHFMPVVHWLQPNREEVSYSLYPYTGGNMERTELYVIDVQSSARTRIDTGSEPDQQIWPLGWRMGGAEVVFMRADRLLKRLDLMAADVKTGRSRVLLTERQDTFVEGVTLSPQVRPQNIYYPVGDNGMFVWRSERNGWSNLYLYEADGRLVRALTTGRAPVTNVATIDERGGWVYYRASGDRTRPYDVQLYRVDLQGRRRSRLTNATGVHSATFSPGKEYFLDSHSSIDRAPAVELRRSDGTLVRKLAQADISALKALNWRKPEEFKAKSADGHTDLHGVLYKPFDFDPTKRYPIIDLEYMGNFAHVVPRTFFDPRYGDDANALTQLGFIVYIVDGRGTPGRGKAFQDLTYKNIGRIEVPDHVAVLKQLAARHPYIDLNRAGITGFSWGGYFAIRAMLTEPDVFKVGVAGAPVVDLTAARHPIEPYMGLPQQNPEGYEYASNVRLADRLKGKLMIAIGTADTNATFGATMRMSNALIQAGKRFDLVVLPEQPHNLSGVALAYYYETRNRYLVEHLHP